MHKLQFILATIVFIGICIIIFVSHSSQQVGFLGISPTPTIDLYQSFQPIVPSSQQQQTNQYQQPVHAQQLMPTQIQQPSTTFGVEEPLPATISAIVKTSKGVITLHLLSTQAPHTVKNFMNKVNANFYTNLTFHRVEDWVVQGGDPKGDGTGGGQMSTELNTLPFTTGSLGVARGNNVQISNDAQFFIAKKDASWLNGQYTNFGQVVSGMDVVNNLQIGDKIISISIQ